MNKTLVAAVGILAMFAVLFAAVVDTEESAAAEVMEYTLSGDVELSEGDPIVVGTGGVLYIESPLNLTGDGEIIKLMPGSSVSILGRSEYMPIETKVTLNGSLSFEIDDSNSFDIDLGNGSTLVLETNTDNSTPTHTQTSIGIVGGTDPEIVGFVSVSNASTLMEISGLGLNADIRINLPSVEYTQTLSDATNDYSSTTKVSVKGLTTNMRLLMESFEQGPEMISANLSLDSVTYSRENSMVSESISASGIDVSISNPDSDGKIPISLNVDSANLSTGTDMVVSIELNGINATAEMSYGDDVLAGDTVGINATFGVNGAKMLGTSTGDDMRLEANLGKTSGAFQITRSALGNEIKVDMDSESASISMKAETLSDRMDFEADVQDIGFGYNGTDGAQSLSIGKASGGGAITVPGIELITDLDLNISGLEYENSAAGETISITEADIRLSDFMYGSSAYTIRGLSMGNEDMEVDSFRIEGVGYDGSSGFMTGDNVSIRGSSATGDIVVSFPQHTSCLAAIAPLSMYFTSGPMCMDVEKGMNVKFEDSYFIPVVVSGGTVEGTLRVCSMIGDRIVSDGVNTILVDSFDVPFDVCVKFDGSSIASAEIVLCKDPFRSEYFVGFEPYDPASGGIPYTVSDDATSAKLDSLNGKIVAGVILKKFLVNANGSTQEYDTGYEFIVTTDEIREGSVFAGATDGFRFVPVGEMYTVMHDATLTDVWLPDTYTYTFQDAVASVDIGDQSEFYVADISGLKSEMAANGATALRVYNSVGYVSVPFDGMPSTGSIAVSISSHADSPISAISKIADGRTIYVVDVSINSEERAMMTPAYTATIYGTGDLRAIDDSGTSMKIPYIEDDDGITFSGNTGAAAYVLDSVESGNPSDGSSYLLIIVGIVIVIVVIAVVAVFLMKRRNV